MDYNFCKDRQEFHGQYFAHINRNKAGLCENVFLSQEGVVSFDAHPYLPPFHVQEELI